MAYDSDRGKIVLFGGADAERVRNDTWEWDEHGWKQASSIGPDPRTFPGMACDGVRKKTILFGGNRVLFGRKREGNKFLNDTRELDGRTWSRLQVQGPPARAEAAMAFDSSRGRVVLFGGYNLTKDGTNRLGDTREWDGVTWRQCAVSDPSLRSGPAVR